MLPSGSSSSPTSRTSCSRRVRPRRTRAAAGRAPAVQVEGRPADQPVVGHVPGGHADLGRDGARAGHARTRQGRGRLHRARQRSRDRARRRSGDDARDPGHPAQRYRRTRRPDVGFGATRFASSRACCGPKAFAALPRSTGEERRFQNALGSGVPTGLLVLGGLLFALLALHEQFSGRLALPA